MTTKTTYNQRYLWLISITAAMGGFLFGYDWVVVGGAKPYYEPFFQLNTPALQGWGTSSALVGCMFGALSCVILSDRYGRKRLLIFAGFLFSLSAIGTALASDFTWFNIYRIIGGVAMGIALNLSPMYIAEISPPEKRGMFVTINQLLVMIGVLMAQVINWRISLLDTALPVDATNDIIASSWSGQAGWRWMFGVEVIPAFLFFVLMMFVPESVRWLVKNGQVEQAHNVLQKIGGQHYADQQVRDVKLTVSKEDLAHVNFKELLNSRVLKFIGLGVFLAFLQQWSGLNVIIYYASDIFQAAGYNLQQMMLNIVVIGTVMVLSVVVTMVTVDKLGRKTLLLFGTSSMALVYALIGYCFYANYEGFSIVLLVLANVMFYSITLAPLLWVVLSEIFPNRIRGAAMSIAAFAHWVGNFTLTFSFPTIKENLGWANNFWLYGVICAVGFIVLYYILPETKGKTLEEIEHELIDSSPKQAEIAR
uniref:Sugar porter family MFS transporter n=1 Tax=Roseihalotalea indica TaxID=2867963 RepID=A0AA49PZX5_9BACT|nr:sugar porter family MFS transporter [Tunicatimonas sp. TK19036]